MGTQNRRKLRFETVNEALAEMDRLVAAEQAGTLSHTGNWSLGKTIGHLATWCEFAFDGYPPEVHAPWPVRIILRMMRNTILTKGMVTGVKVGRVPGGTLGLEEIPTDIAAPRLRAVFTRLANECPPRVNPAFGKLTHAQWIALNIRHAELHFGFQHPA